MYQHTIELMAFLGRYGGMPPHVSLEFGVRYLVEYAHHVGRLIQQEALET